VAKVRRGLLREDLFTVVHDPFLSVTARYADIVLPAAMYLETEDLYRAYGAYYLQYAPQAWLRAARPGPIFAWRKPWPKGWDSRRCEVTTPARRPTSACVQ
jgi:anaerobic selenocysteine-containing dehydrogenase